MRGFLFAAVLILGAAAAGVYWQSRQLYVVVANESDEVLKDVRVSYTGGSASTGRLEPGGSRKFRMHPTGESDLEIVVWDKDAARHEEKGDVSFGGGGGYRGRFMVTVLPGGLVVVTSELN